MAELIVFKSGIEVARAQLPRGEFRIGRDKGCALVLGDPLVAPTHARVYQTSDGYIYEDTGSTHGSSIGGRRVTREPLKDGTRILVGAHELVFSAREERTAPKIAHSKAAAPVPLEPMAGVLGKSVVCLPADATVADAARLMKKANIGSIIIGDADHPEGIFTERDIARRVVADDLDAAKTPLSKVMTRKLVTVDSSEPLEKVFQCLAKGQFRHVPITDSGRIVGIVSLSDLARVLRELYKDEKFLRSFAEGA